MVCVMRENVSEAERAAFDPGCRLGTTLLLLLLF